MKRQEQAAPQKQQFSTESSSHRSMELSYGTILGAVEGDWLVSIISTSSVNYESPVTAEKTFSCLIDPLPGDTVLLAPPVEYSKQWHILSIVRRQVTSVATTLTLPGEKAFIKAQALHISSEGGLQLEDATSMNLTAPTLETTAKTATFDVSEARLKAGIVQCLCSSANTIAQNITQIIGTLTQKMTNSHRHVKERDETFAGSSITMAQDLISLQGRNARLKAEKNIVVNADKIHMG